MGRNAEAGEGCVMSKGGFRCFPISLIASCLPIDAQAACHSVHVEGGFPDISECPQDLHQLMGRTSACLHFAGEITGNPETQRDEEVYQQMMHYRCESIDCDNKHALEQYQKKDAAAYAVYAKTLHELYAFYNEDFQQLTSQCP
jgi:hypothetical protein